MRAERAAGRVALARSIRLRLGVGSIAWIFVLGAPTLFGACGSDHTILASDFNQTCTQASDCVPVVSGTIGCCSSTCNDDAAINRADLSAYTEEEQARTPSCDTACPLIECEPPAVACVGGTCALAKGQ